MLHLRRGQRLPLPARPFVSRGVPARPAHGCGHHARVPAGHPEGDLLTGGSRRERLPALIQVGLESVGQDRKWSELRGLYLEAQLAPLPPVVLGGALIVPAAAGATL